MIDQHEITTVDDAMEHVARDHFDTKQGGDSYMAILDVSGKGRIIHAETMLGLVLYIERHYPAALICDVRRVVTIH